MTRSNPCFYIEGSARPRFLRRGEAHLQIQGIGKIVIGSAFGTNDVDSLDSAYLVSGRGQP